MGCFKTTNFQPLTSRLWMRAVFAFSAIILLMAGYRFDVLVHEKYYKNARSVATLDMLKLRREVEGVLIEQSLMLRELATFVGGHPNISQAEFTSLVQNMQDIEASTIIIAAAPDLVVTMIYPIDGNEGILGFDYRESVGLLPGVLSTLGSGEDMMVGPIELPLGGWVLFCVHQSTFQLIEKRIDPHGASCLLSSTTRNLLTKWGLLKPRFRMIC